MPPPLWEISQTKGDQAHLAQEGLLVEKVTPHKHERLAVRQALRHGARGGGGEGGGGGTGGGRGAGVGPRVGSLIHPNAARRRPPAADVWRSIKTTSPRRRAGGAPAAAVTPPRVTARPRAPVTDLADDAVAGRHQVRGVVIRRRQQEVGRKLRVGAQGLAAVADDAHPPGAGAKGVNAELGARGGTDLQRGNGRRERRDLCSSVQERRPPPQTTHRLARSECSPRRHEVLAHRQLSPVAAVDQHRHARVPGDAQLIANLAVGVGWVDARVGGVCMEKGERVA